MTQREADLAAIQEYLNQIYAMQTAQQQAIAAAQAAIETANKAIADLEIAASTLRETQTRIQALPL
jgi:predicted  nucleic acid-binding Zn-ribbon protein